MTLPNPGTHQIAMGFLAFAIAYLLTPLVRRVAVHFGIVAHPTNDRWGRRIIARAGGIAIYAGFAAVCALEALHNSKLAIMGLGTTLVCLIGFYDDCKRMRPYSKLLLQIMVGCVMVAGGIRIEIIQGAWLAMPLTVFWFVFAMNAFNLLDNMDGLASGVGAIASAFCVIHAMSTGQWAIATMAAAMTGACLGFLIHNFPPAKVFMGDSGSHILGFGLGALVGSSRVDLQACKLEYSIVSPK